MHMTQRTFTYLSWLSFLGALACVCGVIFFASIILGEKASFAARAGESDQASLQQATDARMRALIHDSAASRARLEGLVQVDLLSAVDLIESIGKTTGVKLQVSDASPEANGSGKIATLHAVGFVVGAEGSFPSLMRTVELLETLPLPASIENIDISRTPIDTTPAGGSPPAWHMNLRIRLLTATTISS
jgi:hypothetical protein